MNLATSILPASALKSRLEELIEQTQKSGEPIIITRRGKPAAVLQDVQAYQQAKQAEEMGPRVQYDRGPGTILLKMGRVAV